MLAQGRMTDDSRSIDAGDEQQDGGEPADAAHPDAVGCHLGRGRPRRAARPAGGQLGVDVGGLGPALDDGVGRDQPLAQGGQGQVGLGQDQADVQLGPRLNLEGGLLAVVQERGGKPEAAPVSWTTSEVAPGQAKKPVSRWVSSGTRAPPTMTPARPDSTAAGWCRARPPSSSSWSWARAGCPTGPRPTGQGAPRRRAPAKCRAT